MNSSINNKAISAFLIGLNFVLLIAYLQYGFVTEDEGIRNLYLSIVYIFITCLASCIYYRQNYKTALFWITIVVSILFVIATLFYMYISALGKADWK
ncbi:hypothetical protein [Olivibacter domesticus]|uniref:hypothetical protein n=1 Tax=Olivibacter domesticus TaxID=407022 RepID=UPI001113E696|nr:hypothetical protein [Olivibacter domesticus]